jgi:hypothetical protein
MQQRRADLLFALVASQTGMLFSSKFILQHRRKSEKLRQFASLDSVQRTIGSGMGEVCFARDEILLVRIVSILETSSLARIGLEI